MNVQRNTTVGTPAASEQARSIEGLVDACDLAETTYHLAAAAGLLFRDLVVRNINEEDGSAKASSSHVEMLHTILGLAWSNAEQLNRNLSKIQDGNP